LAISDRAQRNVYKFCMVGFVLLTVLGITALAGFFMHEAPQNPLANH
jgi:hypothetical protein